MREKEVPDYFRIDELLTDEERKLRNVVRRFVDESCMPVIADHFDKGTFPMDLIPEMAGMGLFRIHGDGYGSRKLSETIYGLVCQELGRCDAGLRAMFSVQNSLVMLPISLYGSEEQKRRWLPGMAAGEIIGCFGLSEPEHGSNPAGMRTIAEKRGPEYVLNGSKMWITNAPIAHVTIIWAKLNGEISGFLAEAGTPRSPCQPDPEEIRLQDIPDRLHHPEGLCCCRREHSARGKGTQIHPHVSQCRPIRCGLRGRGLGHGLL